MDLVRYDAMCSAIAEPREFVASARKAFNPGPKEPCAICGKYRGLAQAHHLIPLALQERRGFDFIDQRSTWLCPTHHVAVHALINQSLVQQQRVDDGREVRGTAASIDVVLSLDHEELTAVLRIAEAAFDLPALVPTGAA